MTNDDYRSELASARGSVDAARDSVNELVQSMDRQSKRRTNRVIGFVVFIALSFGAFWHWQEKLACERGNDTRAVLRELTREATLAGGEALIDMAPTAPPERIALYREALDERLTIVVGQLKDRDC